MRVLAVLLLASALRADEETQKMTARLSEEAEAFRKIAVQVLATETLYQRAQKPPSRFHPRVGAAAQGPPAVEWKERHIVSEYGFASFDGSIGAVHELRQVISVDGRKIAETERAQDDLAKAIVATDDARKKEMLKQFEKYGLVGAVTDFGQLILLFTRRELERYEFYLPIRITLTAHEGDAPASIREEASVDYAMTPFGALMPTATEHRELRGGKITAENRFTYSDVHKFGASSDVKFDVAK